MYQLIENNKPRPSGVNDKTGHLRVFQGTAFPGKATTTFGHLN